jgi:hypothetical protein
LSNYLQNIGYKCDDNKSVGPDGVPGEILKFSGKAMTSYIARLLEISLNIATIPSDWKKDTVVPLYKGGDRSAVSKYRPISFTSVVCEQLEHVIAEYLRQVWDKNDWLSEGQHVFRPGYSCGIQVITVCQDITDSLDDGVGIDAIIVDFSKAFDLVPHDRLLTKLVASGVDSKVVVWIR